MNIKGRILQKKLLAILVMIAVCVCAVATYNPDVYAADTSKGVVTATSLNVRSGPGTSYSSVTTVKEGAVVTIVDVGYDESGTAWYQIVTADGTEGWASATYISVKADTDNFDEYIELQGFPESYHEKLKALHKEFPNWIFEAQHTDIKWNDVIAGQYKLGMSLIQDSSSPSSWKSTQDGAYNWETSKWIELDSGGWVAASEDLVKHYVDPRNFIDSDNLFQFLKQSYNASALSAEEIASVKANLETMVAGTFLAGECIEPEVEEDAEQDVEQDVEQEETEKEVKTYVDVLMKAGAESGVVPYVIASMILQEQGKNGTGKSISGTVEGYEGYYNFLNINAYKSGNLSAVQKGLEYAKSKGWDTKEKSIVEGAIYYGESYVAVGQDTMYLKKFDLVGTLYTHQYMTNIQGAASEGKHLAEAYEDEETGKYSEAAKNTALTFKIPVYLSMPSSPCKKPTGDGCPNYMLKNLAVAGESLTPTFSMYDTAYDLIVAYKNSSVTIEATPQHSSAKIEGAGKVNLAVGKNVFDIKVTAENGDERIYTLTIIREEYVEEPDNPDNPDEPVIPDEPVVIPNPVLSTSVYKISTEGFITGIKTFPVKVEDFKKNLTVTDGTIKVLSADGSELSGNVGTGAVVKLYNTEGEEKASYTVIIYGDTNGDGIINAKDLLVIQKNNIQVKALSGVYLTAADVTRDGKVNAKDLLLVQKNNIKVSTIEQ